MSDGTPQGVLAREARQLFLLGFLGLFLELALIRYLSGNVWNLGYFPNLVLIATFLGMGVGFVFHGAVPAARSTSVFLGSSVLLLGLVAFVTFAHPTVPGFAGERGELGGELFFTSTPEAGTESHLAFGLWFLLLVAIFACISQRTAKLFRLFSPLRAYSLDIAGSCLGIIAFMAISWFEVSAWIWFLVLVPVFLGALESPSRSAVALAGTTLAAAAVLAWHQDRSLLSDGWQVTGIQVRWSPYQKVELARMQNGEQLIYVNGLGHQQLLPLSVLRKRFYDIPHRSRLEASGVPYRRVLVIGAGAGNDVAVALANGAEHVDAVEIDPVIAAFGRAHHPARAYHDPRVRLVIDDGRAFLNRADQAYDLIVFALTDSLVKVSPMAQLRLENYVFTKEAITRAFELLRPGGDLVFYNFYRQPWLLEKMRETVRRATGRSPRLQARRKDFALLMLNEGAPREQGASHSARIDVPRDDWPFLYLRERGIPGIYAVALAGVALLVGSLMALLQGSTRRLEPAEAGAGRLLLKVAFVLMGAAFLMLETKGVIQFSLLFGTTWLNNSLVFLSALALVLAANAVAGRITSPRGLSWTFVALLFACALPLLYPLGNLLAVDSAWLRAGVAGLLTFSPIFFANLLFSMLFREQPLAEHLFGWNLLGATLGGLAEYTSMWVGYSALAVLIALLYTVVFLLAAWAGRRMSRPNTATFA